MLLAPLLLACPVAPQDPAAKPPTPAVQPPSQWVTDLSTYWIEPPHTYGYLSAVFTADRGPLHLEAHWAYEDRDTLSLFAGKNIPIEGDLKGSITPRLGIAGGDSSGIIPAVALDLSWSKLNFTTDFEYLIGTSSSTSDFFYSWTELSWQFTERFNAGLVGARTHVYNQELDVDRGLLFGFNFRRTRLTGYLFNLDQDDPYVMLGLGASF